MGKKEQTKKHIIEKVSVLFNKRGYLGTSLSDMVEVTGLSKGSIYGNFKDKEEVAIEAFKYNVGLLTDDFNREINLNDNHIDKLIAYVNVYRRNNTNIILRGGCPIANTLSDCDDLDNKLIDISVDIVARWENQIIGFIEKGLELGEVKKGTSPKVVANLMISLFEGAGMLTKSTGDETYMNDALNHVENLIKGIDIRRA